MINMKFYNILNNSFNSFIEDSKNIISLINDQ